jgi:predicted acetyltransferase
MAPLELILPSLDRLPAYAAALKRGWSPDNIRGEVAAREQLEKIEADAPAFVDAQVDREAKGPPIKLPDGSTAPRIPGYQLWMWDGEFCGSIGFRWQPGTSVLPPHVLGHIGYAVVPWKRRLGYATAALGLVLPRARAEGLPYVEITTDPDNPASQKVILANGGVLVGAYKKPAQYGEADGLRYRIDLAVR